MRRWSVLAVVALGLALAGCQKKDETATAFHAEEPQPYQPLTALEASSTDTYDAAPADDSSWSTTNTASTTPAATAHDERLEPTGAQTYVVQRGDTLYSIARRYYNNGARWRDILAANHDKVRDEKHLKVGTELVIP